MCVCDMHMWTEAGDAAVSYKMQDGLLPQSCLVPNLSSAQLKKPSSVRRI